MSFEVTSVRITKHTIFTTENLLVVEFDGGFPPGSGGFASVEGADWNCTFNASNAGLITGWNGVDLVYHAVISDINNPVKDRIEITSPVYNTNGDLVANNAEDMWDGSLVAPIGYSERGVLIPGTSGVWTGSLGNGTSSFDNCNDWDIQGEFAVVGYASQAGISWLAGGVKDCGRSARLYCISPPIESQ